MTNATRLGEGIESIAAEMERELYERPRVVLEIRDEEPTPDPTESCIHMPRVKDWEKRNYRRPRRKRG